MANYIDWYVIELERRLRGRMPAEQLFAVASEVEDHLELKSVDLVTAGMAPELARRTAVESFGDADVVADEVLEGATNARSKRLGKLLVLGAAAALFVLMSLIAFYGFDPSLTSAAILLLIPLAVAFCRGSVVARRPASAGIALISLFGTIAVAVLLPFGFAIHDGVPASRIWLMNDRGWMKLELGRLQEASEGLNSGITYYRALAAANGDQAKVKGVAPRARDGSYLKLPRYWNYDPGQLGISASSGPNMPIYGGGYMPIYHGGGYMPTYWGPDQRSVSVRPAMDDWLKRGPQMLTDTKRQISGTTEANAAMNDALNQPREYTRVGFLWAGMFGVGAFLGLLSLNATSLGIARSFRRRKTRRAVLA